MIGKSLGFVTSTPLNTGMGSGTYVGMTSLAHGLSRLGWPVTFHVPRFRLINFTLTRIIFNALVVHELRGVRHDLVVGFDLDGFHLAKATEQIGRYVSSVKGVIADELLNERGVIRLLLLLQSKLERLNVVRAPLVLATSRYSRKRIAEAYGIPPEKIRVVPELIDVEAWEAGLDRQQHEAGRGRVILSVAHMYPRKRIDTLLSAFRTVATHHREAELRIVGWGQEYRRLVRLAESLGLSQRVRFLGHVSQEALFHHYKNCEIFCLPSVQEGFGIVFLEAMVAGKPIVAANAAAVPEVVRHGINGLLVAPNDSAELAEALLKLLENRDLREHLGRAGREGVQYYESGAVSEIFLKTVGLIADDVIPRTRSGRILDLRGELRR